MGFLDNFERLLFLKCSLFYLSGFNEFVIDRCNADFEFVDAARRVPLYFIGIASDAADVLHDPGFLVERLLDQKRVVLDLELAGWGRRLLRQRRSGNDEREEKKNRRDSHRPGLYAGRRSAPGCEPFATSSGGVGGERDAGLGRLVHAS